MPTMTTEQIDAELAHAEVIYCAIGEVAQDLCQKIKDARVMLGIDPNVALNETELPYVLIVQTNVVASQWPSQMMDAVNHVITATAAMP